MRPAIIVLAAGLGSRFDGGGGGHKLEQRLGACSVLGTTVRNAVEAGLPVVVVTTARLAALACTDVASRDVIVLPVVGTAGEQSLGIGYSIASGVAARPDAPGWLVLPGDMPLVRPSTLKSVAGQLETNPVAYAQFRGRRGHPVGFSAELYSELATLSGDEGARRLVARYPAFGVDVDDPGVLIDVDTLPDLERVRQLHDATPLRAHDAG